MSVLQTCKRCVREKLACERRDDIKATIAGLGVTSVKFRCKDREPLFSPGQRVAVTWPVPDYDDEYSNYSTLEAWTATAIKEVRSRFLIKVDDTDSDHQTPASEYLKNKTLYAKVSVTRLSPLAEPPRAVCGACHRLGTGPIGEDGCYGYAACGGYRPFGCIAAATGKVAT